MQLLEWRATATTSRAFKILLNVPAFSFFKGIYYFHKHSTLFPPLQFSPLSHESTGGELEKKKKARLFFLLVKHQDDDDDGTTAAVDQIAELSSV